MRFVETKHVEYKRELTDGLEKEIVAFLNTIEGGQLWIGIDATKDLVVGVPDPDQVQLQVKDRIRHNIVPSAMGLFDVLTESVDGKTVVKVTVAGGPEKPYHLRKWGMSEKGCFLRVGSASEPMPARMIEDLFSRRSRNSLGLLRSPRADLGFEQLRIFYQESGFTLNEQFAANLELLGPDGAFNYAAYLLSDVNGMSIKVARYRGTSRVDLIESHEFGYCSLVKATKQVLDRMDLENRTFTRITPKERLERRLLDPTAVREAVINAVVHNDYTREVPPKFELFSDRLEITSAGALPQGFSQDEFLSGYSVPRNKELMRVFKDVHLVEQLGSGVPRILQAYNASAFHFSENFLRIVLPFAEGHTPEATPEVTPEVTPEATPEVLRLLVSFEGEMLRLELQDKLGMKDPDHFRETYLNPALKARWIEWTLPESPRSPKQKYRLTQAGQKEVLSQIAEALPETTQQVTPEATPEVTPEVLRLLVSLEGEMLRLELQEKLGLKDPDHFREAYLNPALKARWIEWTLPESPRSPKQKYRLTQSGKAMRAKLQRPSE